VSKPLSVLSDPSRLYRTLWRRVAARLVRNPPEELSRTLLLAGSGRSGTTWVTELLNAERDYRVIFEPFDARFNPEWSRTRRFLVPGDDARDAAAATRHVLQGRIANPWVDAHNVAIRPSYRLVKAIRANLCLGWIADLFPEVKVVFLLRHPLAVAHSRGQMGWGNALGQLTSQPRLLAHLGDAASALDTERDPFLRQILLWCVENAVALEYLPPGAHTLHYEHLCLQPEATASELFRAIGRPPPANLSHAASRPSALSRDHSAVLLGQRPVDAWVGKIDPHRVRDALAYVEAFGLGHLYGEGALPLES
jgi:hypothetical protein